MPSATNQIEVSTETEESTFAMVLSSAYAFPMTLKAAIDLDVLDIIAKAGPGAQLSPAEIAARITTKNAKAPMMLDRILRLLASYSVLTCTHLTLENGQLERLYGLAPVCKFLVRNEEGVSIAPFLAMIHDKVFMEPWYNLKDAVVDGGIPFDRAFGMSLFEYAGVDARFDEVFNTGMLNHSALVMKKIMETYTGFEGLSSLVDVGGGVGVTLNVIVSKYPKIKGINFDLPHVIASALPYSGVEHIGGDMFESVPSGEAIFMKVSLDRVCEDQFGMNSQRCPIYHGNQPNFIVFSCDLQTILHSWSEEQCSRLLKNCYNALPENGKVIVVEHILPSVPDTNLSSRHLYQMDMLMLAYCAGGKQRTEEEYEELATGSGFAGIRKASTAYNMSVLEFFKK
ncbi:hypothetical protein ACLOJK_032093 [Asimina triloba]